MPSVLECWSTALIDRGPLHLDSLNRAGSDEFPVLPARRVFKIEPKPRWQRRDPLLSREPTRGHVIRGLDRLTGHAAQMDLDPVRVVAGDK